MTRKTKQELIAQIVAMLNAVIEVENEQQITEQKSSAPVEMLTVKECTEAVKGLSEHTVRQLVAQEKIPFIRTGQGKRGKILVSKAGLLEYLGGVLPRISAGTSKSQRRNRFRPRLFLKKKTRRISYAKGQECKIKDR